MPTSKRLRDLIREIRSARTNAEERAVINKECADIRDSFREEDTVYRCRNVAKLLYIYMLGYPAHFGQLECLKLIASPKFTDKRVGYLGAMLLLDERTDVHLLITNCLKNDLNHHTQYVIGLALATLGSICSSEMGRDLAGEVERLIKSNNAYLRKKATLCAVRIIRKVPDLMEMFIPCTRSLLNEKNHGVLLAAVCLITEMCERSPDTLSHFRKMAPNLVKILKNLIIAGYSPEHDVNGVSDPFLQVRILRLLRILGHGDVETSEATNDILAQLATNTETSKNVGHAILYEIVITTMGVESDSGLRVLAVNILGRFLLNTDKNIRYVALKTLQKMVLVDMKAVQRHRATILDCLRDMDVSIRRRALELSLALISGSNVRSVVKELIDFLAICDVEFKADCCSGIVLAARKYAPDIKWHIDTLFGVLKAAGNHARDDVVSSLIQLISESHQLHEFVIVELFRAIELDFTQQPLVQAAAWCIGEYGEVIASSDRATIPFTEEDVLNVFQKALMSNITALSTKEYLLIAIMKLSSRFQTTDKQIEHLLSMYSTSTEVELQQRSVEFSTMLRRPLERSALQGLLEHMPMIRPQANVYADFEEGKGSPNGMGASHDNLNGLVNGDGVKQSGSSSMDILQLLDTGGSESAANKNQSTRPSNDLLDLLGDISSSTPTSTNHISSSTPPPPHSNNKPSNNWDVLSDLNSTGNNQTSKLPSMLVYDKNNIHITFDFQKSADATSVVINSTSVNNGLEAVSDFLLEVAVPKSMQLSLSTPSGSILPAMKVSSVTQKINLTNKQKHPIKMRLRLQYTCQNAPVTDQLQLENFPSTLWQ